MKALWDEALESDYPLENQRIHTNWDTVQGKFMDCYLNCLKPQDVILRFMETRVTKKAMTPCLNHYYCWKESLQNAKKLPVGVKPNPNNEETKEWFFRSLCYLHRNAYLMAGNKIENSSM